ncbi:MAG: STN domain-containing protein [Hyphomicrobium sp.]
MRDDRSQPGRTGRRAPPPLVAGLSDGARSFAPGHSTLAQQPAAGPTQFDIPAQPLETALGAFGAASRLQVLYETSMTEGRRSTEVRSLPSHETALRRLLADTGLDFTYTEERAFTLIYARQFLTRPISDFYPYLGDVQSRIVALLCRYDETRPGAFRIAMQFRIKPRWTHRNPGSPRFDRHIPARCGHYRTSSPTSP